jgi:acyl transferase domain-containing protein/NADP-dependent 3-hydroxy acid dehydrogenase YdfG
MHWNAPADVQKGSPVPESGPFPAHAVAIVGLAGRFPGAADLDQFWDNLRAGREALDDVSDADMAAAGVPAALRSDPLYVRKGTYLEGAELFDAGFFGLSPREAQVLDPQHRIFLECAWEALEHAGYGAEGKGVVGVYAGASMNTYLLSQILRDPAVVEAAGGYQLMLGNDKDFLCTRASYKFDLRGPSMTVQTACSTSLVAVEMACRALRNGECDMALAGGVSVSFPLRSGYLYQDGMILSPDGHCRPFDAAAAGTRPGAGAGLVVLKRLADALADGDTIHAVIRGAAVNNDGADKIGYTAPSVDGQIEAIATAQALAGVDPRTITYIEAHGTATPLGDPIEIRALTEVFRASTDDVGFCRLGSLKANLGHLDAAAGVAGLIKAILALKHREIPPLANFVSPNPQLKLETSPFLASAELTPWESNGVPRRAGVSSFGIGGTNAHVVLEEAPASATASATGPALLVLSALTPTALDQAALNLATHLEPHPEQAMADVAWTLHAGRKVFAQRRAVVAENVADAVRQLREPSKPMFTGVHEGGERPVAFLFSGQGSQHPGMGAGLYETEPVFKQVVDRCAAILTPHLDMDIRDTIFGESGEALNQTRLTQPALFTVELALAKLWESWGVKPRAMMGHSIGEYVAAHLAGVFSLEDALALVAARGRLMQAMQPGSMAAVQLAARDLRARLTDGVEIAAVNGPNLCTVAGPTPLVEAFLASIEASGVDGRLLHTSHAFHSAMMKPALADFVAIVEKASLHAPAIPYVSNLTGTWITPEQATSPAYYAEHLRRAVQFEAGMKTLTADGGLFVLEVGPGNALATLARVNLEGAHSRLVAASLSHPKQKQADAVAMRLAAGQLWLAGVTLDAQGLHGPARSRVPLPTYPFERSRYSVDGPPVSFGGAAATPPEDTTGEVRLYAPTWARDTSPAPKASLSSQPWLVFGADGPLTRAVMAEFGNAGAKPVLLEPATAFGQRDNAFQVRPGSAEDLEAAIQAAGTSAAAISGIVYAWEPTPAETKAFGNLAGYETLVRLAAHLGAANRTSAARIVVASSGAQSVFGEPVRQVDAALTFGAVLALPSELPLVTLRSVDLDDMAEPAVAARLLAEEAARQDAEPFVAWRAGCRWLRRYEPLQLGAGTTAPVKQGGVYLITGGLGGLGLELADWLAGTASARLLLTSRSPLPARETWDGRLAAAAPGDRSLAAIRAIRAIEDKGGEVITAVADAADAAAMRLAIDRACARWGAIDGVIHAAGVPGAGEPSFLETTEEMRSVISPKRDGLTVLTELLGDAPLDFVVLMSSINAIFPSPNAGPYAAGNAVLDSFAESDAAPSNWKRVLSVNWTAWREVGMAANLSVPDARRAERAAFLKQAIEPMAGVQAFVDLLASDRKRAVATSFDLLKAMNRIQPPAPGIPAQPDAAGKVRPQLARVTVVAPAGEIESGLAAIWAELLGVPEIGADDDFFVLGGHSLLATRMLARISSRFGARLALRDVFDKRTVRDLAEHLSTILNALQAEQDDQEEILI